MTTDPFESLREPLVPLAPSAEFAARLRRRLVDALAPTPQEEAMPEIREYTPARLHSLTPYLACRGADRAIEWYREVFGASVVMEPILMADGKVGHAELRVGDTVFMVADEYPPERVVSPEVLGGNSVSLMLYVPDSEATFRRALEHGATELRPMDVAHGDRVGIVVDPFGHRWFLSTALEPEDRPVEDVPGRRAGDIGYVTLGVPDGERAAAFFGALFGWDIHPGNVPGGHHIASVTPPAGIHGRDGAPEVRLYFRVDDVETTAARVRELGGEVLSVQEYESGGNAECVDDQGFRFDLFRPRPGY